MRATQSEQRIVSNLTEVFNRQSETDAPVTFGKLEELLSAYLAAAGLSYRKMRRWAILAVVVTGLVFLALGPVIGTGIAIVAASSFAIVIQRGHAKRYSEVDRDLPSLLSFLASSVRAGLDPLVALVDAQNYLPDGTVLRGEVRKFGEALKSGESEEGCIKGFCSSISHPDVPLLRACLLISRRHGTSIAEPLHRVTRVVRQRQSFRRKVRGALVMHRMSAVGIALCATLISLMQFLTNYTAMMAALHHPIGSKVIMGGMALISVGVLWMMSLGKREAR